MTLRRATLRFSQKCARYDPDIKLPSKRPRSQISHIIPTSCLEPQARSVVTRSSARSLVIMDELGRGTSTHDGTAIAAAVLHHMATKVLCPTLFITHYPELAELVTKLVITEGGDGLEVKEGQVLQCRHMAFLEEEEYHDSDDDEEGKDEATRNCSSNVLNKRITFLYKAVDGVARDSYGLNVARLAGLPSNLIGEAERWSLWMKHRIEVLQKNLRVWKGEEEESQKKDATEEKEWSTEQKMEGHGGESESIDDESERKESEKKKEISSITKQFAAAYRALQAGDGRALQSILSPSTHS